MNEKKKKKTKAIERKKKKQTDISCVYQQRINKPVVVIIDLFSNQSKDNFFFL